MNSMEKKLLNGQKAVVKNMTADDIPDIIEIEKRSFSDPWSYGMFEDALDMKGQYFFCVTVDGRTAGYCGMMIVLDEGQILNVAVDGEYRRLGLGQLLMDAMFECGIENGVKTYTLEVRESNFAARSLYKKNGFAETGKRPSYYTNPSETAILMDAFFEDCSQHPERML